MSLRIPFLFIRSDWITLVFILIFLALVAAKYFYKERLWELISLFFSKHYLLNYGKESQLIFGAFNALLFSVQIIALSLFLFLYFQFYTPYNSEQNSIWLFIKIINNLSLFFFIRFSVGFIFGIVFNLKKLQNQLAFHKMISFFSVLILILPFLLLTFYMKSSNLVLFQLSCLILCILLIVRYVFVIKNNKNALFGHFFYFIVYLCALEIAPVLLVLKLIN